MSKDAPPRVVIASEQLGTVSIWLHPWVFDPDLGQDVSGYVLGPDRKLVSTGPLPVDPSDTVDLTPPISTGKKLDFEIYPEDKAAEERLGEIGALYMIVGPAYPEDDDGRKSHWQGIKATPSHNNRSGRCLLLEKRDVRGRPVWRVRPHDARTFFSRYWRQTDVHLLLATGKEAPVTHSEDPSVPVQWAVRIDYEDPWLRDTYVGVLRDHLRLTLPAFEDGNAIPTEEHVGALAHEGTDVHAALHAYTVAEEIGRLAEAAREVVQAPRPRLDLHVVTESLPHRDAARQWAARPFGQPVKVLAATRISGNVVPTRFLRVEHPSPDRDTRLIAASILVAKGVGTRTLKHLEDPVGSGLLYAENPKAEAFLKIPRSRLEGHIMGLDQSLARLGSRLDRYGLDAGLLRREQTASVPVDRLRRLTLSLQDLDSSYHADVSVRATWEPTNKIYERWCTLRVIQALFDLGFHRSKSSGVDPSVCSLARAESDAGGKGLDLEHPRLRGYLRVRLEPRYCFGSDAEKEEGGAAFGAEDRYRQGRSSVNARKSNPDVALEHWTPGAEVPRIVTLDPTTSRVSKHLAEKYIYYDTLRSFVTCGVEGESARIVAASWALYPGEEGGRPYEQEMPEADHAEVKWRWGRYALNARDASLSGLAPWLEGLLTGVGFLSAAEGPAAGRS